MLENILFIVSQILTVVILPAVKWWLDKGNKQLVGQIESLNKEVKKTQTQATQTLKATKTINNTPPIPILIIEQ